MSLTRSLVVLSFVSLLVLPGQALAANAKIEVTHESSKEVKGYYENLPKGTQIMLIDFYEGDPIAKVKPVKVKKDGSGNFVMKVPARYGINGVAQHRLRAVGPESLPIIYDESYQFSFGVHPDKEVPDCKVDASKYTVKKGEKFTLTWSSKKAKNVQSGLPGLEGELLGTKGRYTHTEQRLGINRYDFAFNGVVYGSNARYTQSGCSVYVNVI